MFDDVNVFEPVRNLSEGVSGVYRLYHVDAGQYVGSARDVRSRCEKHAAEIATQCHSNAKLQEAWNAHPYGWQAQLVYQCEPMRLRYYEQLVINALRPTLNIYRAVSHREWAYQWLLANAGELARQGAEIGFQATRVLLLMLGAMKFENEIVLSNGEAARELDMSPSNVSRATKRLVELGVLEEGPKLGALKSYRLNPGFGWKGKGVEHIKALNGGKA